jgi:hypothetical protein
LIKSSLDEAEVGRERVDFIRRQAVRDARHRPSPDGMISLAPLPEPPFQVRVGKAAQRRCVQVEGSMPADVVFQVSLRAIGLPASGRLMYFSARTRRRMRRAITT